MKCACACIAQNILEDMAQLQSYLMHLHIAPGEGHLHRGWISAPKLCHRRCAHLHIATVLEFCWSVELGSLLFCCLHWKFCCNLLSAHVGKWQLCNAILMCSISLFRDSWSLETTMCQFPIYCGAKCVVGMQCDLCDQERKRPMLIWFLHCDLYVWVLCVDVVKKLLTVFCLLEDKSVIQKP